MTSGDAILHIANHRQLEVITRAFAWPDGEADEPDFDEPRFENFDCEPDTMGDDNSTTVSNAVEHLRERGITQPSSSPGPWNKYTWFSYVDGSYETNAYTGEREELSAHPNTNFTHAEVDAIAACVTGIAEPFTLEITED